MDSLGILLLIDLDFLPAEYVLFQVMNWDVEEEVWKPKILGFGLGEGFCHLVNELFVKIWHHFMFYKVQLAY